MWPVFGMGILPGILPMLARKPTFTTKLRFAGREARAAGYIATGSEPDTGGRLGNEGLASVMIAATSTRSRRPPPLPPTRTSTERADGFPDRMNRWFPTAEVRMSKRERSWPPGTGSREGGIPIPPDLTPNWNAHAGLRGTIRSQKVCQKPWEKGAVPISQQAWDVPAHTMPYPAFVPAQRGTVPGLLTPPLSGGALDGQDPRAGPDG